MKRAIWVVGAAVLLATMTTLPASAQKSVGDTELTITNQSTWVQNQDPFQVSLKTKDSLRVGDNVVAKVYRKTTSAFDFSNSLNSLTSRSVVKTAQAKISEDQIDSGEITVQVNTVENDRPVFQGDGVYPVFVGIERNGTLLPNFSTTTYMLLATNSAPDDKKLQVANVLQGGFAPALTSRGTPTYESQIKRPLNVLLKSLNANQETPISLRLFGNTLDGLAATEDKKTLQALQAVSRQRPLLSAGEVPFNESTNENDISQQVGNTSKSADALRLETNNQFWTTEHSMSVAAIENLASQGVKRFLIPFSGETSPVLLTKAVNYRAGPGAYISGHTYDLTAMRRIFGNSNQILAAHNALAYSAAVYFAQPAIAGRSFLTVSPGDWVPNSRFLTTYLEGINTSPVSAPVHLDSVLGPEPEVVPTKLPDRELSTVNLKPAESQIGETSTEKQSRTDAKDFRSLVLEDNEVMANINQRFSIAISSSLNFRAQQSYYRGIRSTVNTEFAKILPPPNSKISLAKGRATFPVTVRSTTGYPVRVLISLRGEQVEFVTSPDRVLLVDRQSRTARFSIKARTSGNYPIHVTVQSPTRGAVLAQSTVQVSAFAASYVGGLLSVLSIAVLVLWWGKHFWTKRRAKTAKAPS